MTLCSKGLNRCGLEAAVHIVEVAGTALAALVAAGLGTAVRANFSTRAGPGYGRIGPGGAGGNLVVAASIPVVVRARRRPRITAGRAVIGIGGRIIVIVTALRRSGRTAIGAWLGSSGVTVCGIGAGAGRSGSLGTRRRRTVGRSRNGTGGCCSGRGRPGSSSGSGIIARALRVSRPLRLGGRRHQQYEEEKKSGGEYILFHSYWLFD